MQRVIPATAETQEVKAVSKFVPGGSYEWEPTDRFVLLGEEYSVLLHVIRALATNPGGVGGLPPAVTSVNLAECHRVLETILVSGVESGVIRRIPGPQERAAATPLPGQ